jgi:hypothetical protein
MLRMLSGRGWRHEGIAKCPGSGQGPNLALDLLVIVVVSLSFLNFPNLIRFSDENFVRVYPLFCACYLPRQTHVPSTDHPDSI